MAIPPGPHNYNQGPGEAARWLRPMQVKDQLVLSVGDGMYGASFPPGVGDNWVRAVTIDAAEVPERLRVAKEQFDALDLAKIEELKQQHPAAEESKLASNRPPGAIMLPAKLGDVFVGRFRMHDPRAGRPVEMTFKILVEELAGPSKGAE